MTNGGYRIDSLQIRGSGNVLTAEASDLGFVPGGTWPYVIKVAGGATFTWDRDDVHNGELAGAYYVSDSGQRLLVIND